MLFFSVRFNIGLSINTAFKEDKENYTGKEKTSRSRRAGKDLFFWNYLTDISYFCNIRYNQGRIQDLSIGERALIETNAVQSKAKHIIGWNLW